MYHDKIELSQEEIDRIKEDIKDEITFRVNTTIALRNLRHKIDQIGETCVKRGKECANLFPVLRTHVNIQWAILIVIITIIIGTNLYCAVKVKDFDKNYNNNCKHETTDKLRKLKER